MDPSYQPYLYLSLRLFQVIVLLFALALFHRELLPTVVKRTSQWLQRLPVRQRLLPQLDDKSCALALRYGVMVAVTLWSFNLISGSLLSDLPLWALFLTTTALILSPIRKQRRYRQKIHRALPHCCDLVALMLQSGQGLTMALLRTSKFRSIAPLGAEITGVLQRAEAGKPLGEALHEMAVKFNLPELRTMVDAMALSHRTGGQLASTLRELAQRFTAEQLRLADLHANKVPVKLLAPLFLCIFPATFLLLFYPLLYRLFHSF